MTTETKIREAFEAWFFTENPDHAIDDEESAWKGYKAAMASLEHDCTDCANASLKE